MTEGSRASPSYYQALATPGEHRAAPSITRFIADRGYLARALLEKSIEKQILVRAHPWLADASRRVSRHDRIDARKWLSQKAKHNPQIEWLTHGG
jgi:hypothetical protein